MSLWTNELVDRTAADKNSVGQKQRPLIHDSGEDDEERILIFASNKGLDDIGKAEHIGTDGTFDVTPKCYEKGQLCTIHMIVQHVAIPRLYILLPNKKGDTYRRLYRIIITLNPRFYPKGALIDFELAHINALKEAFPGIDIWGCLFHLSQNIYRKVLELGYKRQYSVDSKFRELIGCFSALAALPEEDVIVVFEAIIELDVDEKLPTDLISYFENHYIGQQRRNRRLEPTFSLEVWNIRDRILNDLPRTNNAIEGFHSNLHHHITNSHPSLWKLINGLKIAEQKARKKLSEYERGDDFDQKVCYQRLTKRLKNLVNRYDSSISMEDKIKFVKAVANIINS